MHYGIPAVFDQEYSFYANNFIKLQAAGRAAMRSRPAIYSCAGQPVLLDKRLQARNINVDAGTHGTGKGNLSQVGSFGR
jgi:hypothetical protein